MIKGNRKSSQTGEWNSMLQSSSLMIIIVLLERERERERDVREERGAETQEER